MQNIKKQILVPCTVAEIYSLVNDIKKYPEFIPWCESTNIQVNGENMLIATINAAKGPIRQSFTSKNNLVLNKSIDMELVAGPFKTLVGYWRFIPQLIEPDLEYCRIEFELKFEFSNRLLELAFRAWLPIMVTTIMQAFLTRAEVIYGKKISYG